MFIALIKTMRPRQWPKNIFVFAALVFDKQLFHRVAFLETLAGFFLFCLISRDLGADGQGRTELGLSALLQLFDETLQALS